MKIEQIESKKTIELGFIDKGTGKHQSNVVYSVGGVVDLAYPDSTERRGRVQDKGRMCPTISTIITYYIIEENNKNEDSGN